MESATPFKKGLIFNREIRVFLRINNMLYRKRIISDMKILVFFRINNMVRRKKMLVVGS